MPSFLDGFLRELDPPEVLDEAEWLKQELPDLFPYEWGPHHLHLISTTKEKPSGIRSMVAAPRGSGKTTVAHVGKPLACIARGTHEFVVIIKVDEKMALRGLQIIRDILDSNPHLQEKYPNLRYRFKGNRRAMDNADEIELMGGRIMARGAHQSIRGQLRKKGNRLIRPDLVLIDDIETASQVRSREMTDRLEEWLFADVAGLTGPGETVGLDIVWIDTTRAMTALAVRALENQGRFAGWSTKRFPAEYRDDSGGRVATWEGQPLSFLDQLTQPGPLFVGAVTYANEYLLKPTAREDSQFKEHWVQYGAAPEFSELVFLTFGLDPAGTEKTTSDYSAGALVGLDRSRERIWIIRVWRDRLSQGDLFDRVQRECRMSGASVAYEAVGGFVWGVKELRNRRIPHRPIRPQTDKVSRAQPVSLFYEQGMVYHDYSLKGSEFEKELFSFPGQYDDMVDAMVHAVRMATQDGSRVKYPNKVGEAA